MAAQKFSLVQGRVIRATRLDGCGRPQYGECATVVSDGFTSVAATAVVDTGDEINVKKANGKTCVQKTPCPTLNGYTFDLTFCEVDPDLFAMFTNQDTVLDPRNGDAIGFRVDTTRSGCDAGVALEIWSEVPQVQCEGDEATGTFGYFLYPFLQGGVFGDITIENDAVTFTITGAASKGGSGWGIGPYNVTLGIDGEPGPLTEPITAGVHLHFQLTYVEPPEVTFGCIPLDDPDAPAATGATAGDPGTWTPAGTNRPDDLAALQASGIVATPNTLWEFGDHVVLEDGSKAYWDGDSWEAGESPNIPSTGATAGIPGTWTPVGSQPPEDVPELIASAIIATPGTAWTTGQYVQTQEGGPDGRAHWDGSDWVAGVAP